MSRLNGQRGALKEERDHVAIQTSLVNEAMDPKTTRLRALERKLAALELSISRWRPPDA